MKKLIYLIPVLSLFLITCKKNDLTADGKPQSDAANNIIRVDTKAGANYQLSISSYNVNSPGENSLLYSNADQSSAVPFEFSFKGVQGYAMLVEVYSQNGTFANCDIYYKGLKVPTSLEAIDQLQGEMPSHINVTYRIGITTVSN
jgi:hypothetical protein